MTARHVHFWIHQAARRREQRPAAHDDASSGDPNDGGYIEPPSDRPQQTSTAPEGQ